MNNRIKINESDIVDTVTLCPYCMSEPKSDLGCCGESSAHFAEAFVTKDDEAYLISDVQLIDDDRNDQSNSNDDLSSFKALDRERIHL